MRKITKIRRSIKAISPVISVLLMIAIAVAASLVAYAWVSGYMDFTTTKVGKSIQIQSVATTAVYVQNIGDSDVEIADLYVDGTLESWSSISVESVSTQTVGQGETATIWLNSPLPRTGNQATIKIVTSDGISAEYKETFSSISSNPSQTQYLVTVASTANGGIVPATGYVAEGSTPTYTITPSTNYQIASITANGVSVTVTNPAGQTYTFPAVSGSCTLTATFTEIAATTYTITASAGAGGSISPSGSVVVTEGDDQPFTITAEEDYHIVDVVVDSVSQGAISTYNFPNVVANHAIDATFAADTIQYTVTVAQTDNGAITPETGLVDEGSTPSYTITPDSYYHIASITANGNPVTVTTPEGQTYQFDPITEDCTLTATFAENLPTTITLRPNAAGSTTELEAQGSSTNFECVNEETSDDASTYVRGTADDEPEYDTYDIADQSLTGTISQVRIYVNVRKDGTSNNDALSASTAIRLNDGTVAYGDDNSIRYQSSWTTFDDIYTEKPSELGGGAWTWADINNLEIGVSLTSHQSSYGGTSYWTYAQCTQVWIEITYTPA